MPVKDFVTIKRKKIDRETIPITEKTWKWCQLPYPGHKNGCPNYGNNPLCPPNAKFFDKSDYNHFYLIHAEFDFKGYVADKRKDPARANASDKQLGNIRHWQGSVKKLLKDAVKDVCKMNKRKDIYILGSGSGFSDNEMRKIQDDIYSMEAAGVYAFGLFKNNGISFEIKPTTKIVIACMICSKKRLVLSTRSSTILDFF